MEKSEFLKSYQIFQLGILPTEQPNEKTLGLSNLIHQDINQALTQLKEVDLDAAKILLTRVEELKPLRKDIQQTLNEGGRIFLCGCGATGRLSLLLEYLWREKFRTDQVQAFMAGGDVALVHSLEGFEDYPDLGARHLKQLGFTENDLLVSCTEGGETPYVIGATEEAARISKRNPYFLYCNPRELLVAKIERSKNVIENKKIVDIDLSVGPMGLSGSTRMQASTVLQLAVGACLLCEEEIVDVFQQYLNSLEMTDFRKLAPFIEQESAIYRAGEYLIYAPHDFGITVFTDTTERSPTFSLPSFEGDQYEGTSPSLCYIQIPGARTIDEAWDALLLRDPIPLNWQEIDEQTSQSYLDQFDFSESAEAKRAHRLKQARQHLFEISKNSTGFDWRLNQIHASFDLVSSESLIQHTLLKVLLNSHSTLLMGSMGRFQSNIMTWVRPTNGKLVDRATRYIIYLLSEQSIDVEYLQVVEEVYSQMANIGNNSIVLRVFEKLRAESQKLKEGHL